MTAPAGRVIISYEIKPGQEDIVEGEVYGVTDKYIRLKPVGENATVRWIPHTRIYDIQEAK